MKGQPTKPDETALWDAFVREPYIHLGGRSVYVLSQNLNMPYKRARYIVRDKWATKGKVDYGASWRSAWIVELPLITPKP